MVEFYVSLSNHDIAQQVTTMVNTYNRWYTKLSTQALLISSASYFTEIECNRVVGCASFVHEYNNYTKIQHICVLPSHRQRGIAHRLSELAIANSKTEYVYMTIREDNISSIKLAKSLKFVYIKKHWFRDHWTLTFGRRREHVGNNYTATM